MKILIPVYVPADVSKICWVCIRYIRQSEILIIISLKVLESAVHHTIVGSRQILTNEGKRLGPTWIFVRLSCGGFYATLVCLECELNVYFPLAIFCIIQVENGWLKSSKFKVKSINCVQWSYQIPEGYLSSTRK